MVVSNKKKKSILKDHPEKSILELAAEYQLSQRQIIAILREAGRLPPRSLRPILSRMAAGLAVMAVAAALLLYFTRPSEARFVNLRGKINVLVITVDTLRADRLGCYGWKDAHTPNIDDLAQSGVRFTQAFSAQPLTLPSHATIFTGTHPAFHGINDNGFFRLAPEAMTLAEVLRENGFSTGAVVSSFVLHRQFGLDQGFDYYDDWLDGRGQDPGSFDEMPATAVSDRGMAWIQANAGRQWFLWLHYYDPHANYDPPAEHRGLASPYDGEIAYVDAQIGRVLSLLHQLDLRDRTLIVLTADHGESLGEHGEKSHGLFLYDSTQHVPLMFSLPGAIASGQVRDRQFRLRDIMPTILAALHLQLPAPVQGEPLLKRFYQAVPAEDERPVLMETYAPWDEYGFSPSFAIRADGYKYIQSRRPELYDLRADPNESVNLVDREPARAREMSLLLKKLRAELSRSSLAAGAGMDDSARDRLASLGYLSSHAAPVLPAADAPDVKDMLKVLADMDEAQVLKSQGRTAEAIALLERVVAAHPDSRRTLNRLGLWLEEAGDRERARQYLERLITIDPAFIEGYENLGSVYLSLGRMDDAETMADKMLQIIPGSAKGHNLLGIADFNRGDYNAAIPHFQRAVQLYPTLHAAMANLGACYGTLGDYRSAVKWLDAALKVQPGNQRYRQMAEAARQQAR